MDTVENFIKFISKKPEKIGKVESIFPDLGWGFDKNGYQLMSLEYFTKMLETVFKNETNRFKQP